MSKLKVVWICHFTNKEIQDKLPLRKRINQFASWIPNTLRGFENRDDIELHVVAPHYYLTRKTTFKLRGIYYSFIPCGIPFWHRPWPSRFPFDILVDILTNDFYFRGRVKRLVNSIKPDIINLQGAENAYYSSAILNLKDKYPVIITIQGFISLAIVKRKSIVSKGIKTEQKILREFKYFICNKDSVNFISKFNNDFTFFECYYPVNETLIKQTNNVEKVYDLIFYGRITKDKGIEDFIEIVSKLKLEQKNISACVIGPGSATMQDLKSLAHDLGCLENINFVGFVETQAELFKYVKASKVFLVPTYNDRLPSTIREAMWLKVSVVSYATGGIPVINQHQENIFLVEQGNKNKMAEKAYFLLQHPDLRTEMEERAFLFAQKEFELESNVEKMINAYHKVIDMEEKDYEL